MSDVTLYATPTATRTRYVREYEALGRHGPTSLAPLLPPPSAPEYMWALVELVRADLEYRRAAGSVANLEDYRSSYPELFEEPEYLRNLKAGVASSLTLTPPPARELELTRPVSVIPAAQWNLSEATSPAPGSDAFILPLTLPSVGEKFLGFHLVAELGAGAFGKVFLAHQSELSDRPVALKITTRPTREPQRLARLRHTNVVPIYSVHDQPPLQAVCMPFLGRQTFADLIRAYRATGTYPRTSQQVASTAMAGRTTLGSKSQPASVPASIPAPLPTTVPDSPTGPAEVDFVLDLMTRVAGGLAHAHDQGILHLDLKPANILFADDGQPLLLDFNLAFDLKADDREKAGGTLPYMAPEQLEEYRDRGPTRVDHRTDLFALGVIFFELLTGRHPYPPPGNRRPDLTEMAEVRRAGPPSVRAENPAVPAAVESIVHKLLAPDPAHRYQSAKDLATDLDRHRQDLPLRFAPNNSVVERVAKWRRRNPGALVTLVLSLAIAAVAGTGLAAYRHSEARERAEGVTLSRLTRDAVGRLRVDLTSVDNPDERAAAIHRGRGILACYDLPARPDVSRRLRELPERDRVALLDSLGELSALMAHAERLNGRGRSVEEQEAAAGRGLVWNRAAAACFEGRKEPVVIAQQRKRLAGELDAELETLAVDLDQTCIDLFLIAAEQIAAGRRDLAIQPLELLVSLDSNHFGGQFALAYCRHKTGDKARALERYQVARALAPDDPRPSYNRGLILLNLAKGKAAVEEFTDALNCDPRHASSYYYRAVARLWCSPLDLKAAEQDVTRALEYGASPIQCHLLRARVYDQLGDTESAEKERVAAKELQPVTALDFVARGRARMKDDAAGALADFMKAAELDPQYVSAWQNQAHVLADLYHQPLKALDAQDRAVESARDLAYAWSGRAVLRARVGQRDGAHADAQKALNLSEDAEVAYQVACVYSLTSATHPEDRDLALKYLRRAFRNGFLQFEVIKKDSDVDNIRNMREFRQAIDAAKTLGY